MRKFLISAALAATALTFAAPAAAQWAPPPPAYGNQYGAPYGNAYGHNNYGQIRSLQVRIDNLQRQIRRFDQRNILSDREAARLMNDSRDLERRLFRSARYGFSYGERQAVEIRLARLEQRLWREARDGNRWGNQRYGERDWDRDNDGRDDRYEREHDKWHDRNDDDHD